MMDRDYQLLDSGHVLGKTVGDVLHAFGLAIRLRKARTKTRKGLSCLLYFYDPPGEDFLTMQRLGRKHVIQRVSGIVLLADPFAAPRWPNLVALRAIAGRSPRRRSTRWSRN